MDLFCFVFLFLVFEKDSAKAAINCHLKKEGQWY